jgi:hypothetical protein
MRTLEDICGKLGELGHEIGRAQAELQHVLSQREALEAKRCELQVRLADLHEAAAKILRSGAELPEISEHLTILRAAELVLSAKGESMHYADVADEAIRRGFRSDSPPETIRTSFRRMMHKNPEVFEMVGDGMYRLRRKRDAEKK